MTGISRRNLLKQLAVGGLIAAAPASFLLESSREVFEPFASRLSRVFSNIGSARAIGRHYLTSGQDPADRLALATGIAGDVRGYLRLSSADTSRLRTLLAEQQMQDFALGRTVTVDGWVLSVTEARLCALAALSASRIG